MKRLLSAVLPLALLLVACADSSERTGSDGLGTIHGQVLAGPTCPVETVENPCPDRPVAGVKVEALRDGNVAATAVSDENGGFAMDLAPGAYVIQSVVEPEGPGMYSKPARVSVAEGDVVDVIVLLDTGIRAPVGTGGG